MKFDEIPLYEAVYDARCEVESPGAEVNTLEHRETVCQLIRSKLPFDRHFNADEMMTAWTRMRKSPGKKLDLTVEVGRRYGWRCFMLGRGQGDCSEEVNLDRLIPGSRSGEYTVENCMIMCSHHNTQRGDRTLEEYLLAPPNAS